MSQGYLAVELHYVETCLGASASLTEVKLNPLFNLLSQLLFLLQFTCLHSPVSVTPQKIFQRTFQCTLKIKMTLV